MILKLAPEFPVPIPRILLFPIPARDSDHSPPSAPLLLFETSFSLWDCSTRQSPLVIPAADNISFLTPFEFFFPEFFHPRSALSLLPDALISCWPTNISHFARFCSRVFSLAKDGPPSTLPPLAPSPRSQSFFSLFP